MAPAATTTDSGATLPTTTACTCCCGSRIEVVNMSNSESKWEGGAPGAGRVNGRLALLAAAVFATAGLGVGVRADEPDAAAQLHAQQVAITVCGTCHGPQGNSTQPKFPRLAAQKDSYLVTQLKAFRAETRGDPDAIGYMWGMASELDDETIDALARCYPRHRCGTRRARPRDLRARHRIRGGAGLQQLPRTGCAWPAGLPAAGGANPPKPPHARGFLSQ